MNLKKIFSLMLSITIACGFLTAGAHGAHGDKDGSKVKVVATIFPQYDFTREIAGDKIELSMLLRPGAESHSFDPTPQDIIDVKNCDVFIYVGGESDEWVKEILESMDTSKMKILSLMDMVEPVEEEIVEGMEEEAEEEEGHDHEAELDEHVWTSPVNVKLIVSAIADALCEADGGNARFYRNNAAAYLKKLDVLDADFKSVADKAARKTIIVGDRFPFRYLADAYGLSYYAAFPGCSTETEASAGTIAFLIDKVKSERIPVVFNIELSNEKMSDVICEAAGAKKLLLHACHNITKKDFDNGANYIGLMTQNVKNLKEALW